MPIYDLNVAKKLSAFKEKIAETRPEPVIVLYYMKMCPHCVMMKPAWSAAKKAINTRTVNIAEVEYENLVKLPKNMQTIRGFPSIKVYRGTKVIDEYLGERTQDGFINFMQKYVIKKK